MLFWRKLLKKLQPRHTSKASESRQQHIDLLRERIRALPPLPLSVEHRSELEWMGNRQRLRQLILDADPSRFLEWDVIGKTMFVGDAPWIIPELESLRASSDWQSVWAELLIESGWGYPERSIFLPSSSGNLIHHAYTLFRWEAATGKNISQYSSILEFGGGYGSLARIICKKGFKGRYVIFDLPEFSALQEFFLNGVGGSAVCGQAPDQQVWCISQWEELEMIVQRMQSIDLFIALWSLSETPIPLRCKVRELIHANLYCIAFQDRFNEVDNLVDFSHWRNLMPDLHWQQVAISHLPGNYYLWNQPER